MHVWIAARLTNDERGWECNGVFSTKEKALAVCKDEVSMAVEFVLDEDATEITEFLVCTPDRPEGILA
jgi:hypothetical protein